jgi:hypothetical protein
MTKLRLQVDQQPGAGSVNGGLIAVNQARFDRTHSGLRIEGLARHGVMRYVPDKPEEISSY